jgi:hypothetical protein
LKIIEIRQKSERVSEVVAVAAAEGLVASVVDPKAAQVATGGNQTVTNQPWDAHLEEPCLQLYSQDVIIYIYMSWLFTKNEET